MTRNEDEARQTHFRDCQEINDLEIRQQREYRDFKGERLLTRLERQGLAQDIRRLERLAQIRQQDQRDGPTRSPSM